MALTVVVPVLNGAQFLERCLMSLQSSSVKPAQYVVVNDGSTDGSERIAAAMGAKVVHTEGRTGPAAARNLGVAHSSGDLVVFIDSDVVVHPDTLERIEARFRAEPDLDALIGSYDDDPESPGFVSQYKNLMNYYFHQRGDAEASTFWSGCGAIRRQVFLEQGGFDESFERPSIEDIDLGYRLRKAGRRIALDGAIQVKHLKQWSLGRLLLCDVFDRALPWTRLILRSGWLPNDLNVSVSQRAAALLAWTSLGLAAGGLMTPLLLAPALAAGAGVAALNRGFFRMLAARRGWVFAAEAFPLFFAYYLYSSLAFAAGLSMHLASGLRRRPSVRPAPAVRSKSAGAGL